MGSLLQVTTSTQSVSFNRLVLSEGSLRAFEGGGICGSFVVFGTLSVLLYKPWRRWIDRRRQIRYQPQQLQEDEELGTITETDAATHPKDGRRVGDVQIMIGDANGTHSNGDTVKGLSSLNND